MNTRLPLWTIYCKHIIMHTPFCDAGLPFPLKTPPVLIRSAAGFRAPAACTSAPRVTQLPEAKRSQSWRPSCPAAPSTSTRRAMGPWSRRGYREVRISSDSLRPSASTGDLGLCVGRIGLCVRTSADPLVQELLCL